MYKRFFGVISAFLVLFAFQVGALPSDYLKLDKVAKRAVQWRQLNLKKFKTLPSYTRTAFNQLASCPIVLATLGTSLNRHSDEMPWWRPKMLHNVGVEAPMSFYSSGKHPFTGFLSETDIPVLSRISLGAPPIWSGLCSGNSFKVLCRWESTFSEFAFNEFTKRAGTKLKCFS